MISITVYAQKRDTLKYVYYEDMFGNKRQATIAHPNQILIVDGDSLYTVSTISQLQKILENHEGFDNINNPDSISLFLRNRIKGITILKKKEKRLASYILPSQSPCGDSERNLYGLLLTSPTFSVKTPVLNRLRQVLHFNIIRAG